MAINFGSIQVGQKYEFPGFKEVNGTFTATKSGKMLYDGGEVDIYKDPDHTEKLRKDGPDAEMIFAGFGNGGKYTFNAVTGQTYYFSSGNRGCLNSRYILLSFLDNISIVKINPPDGSVFEPTGYGSSDIEFNQPVDFEEAFITCSSKILPVTAHKNSSSISFDIKNQLWSLYKDDTITAQGQKFTLTIKGVKNNTSDLYNGDGNLVINYLTAPKPISVINTKKPSAFRSSFSPEDPDSVFELTFDKPVDPKKIKAKIFYGVAEIGDYYQEEIKCTVEGNKIKINFAGKRRTPKDMLRSGNVYPTIGVQVMDVYDTKGNMAWSDDQGSFASLTFNFTYQA